MKLKTARKAIYACMGVALFCVMIYVISRRDLFIALALAAIIAELILFYLFIRCPHCGRFLDRSGMRFDAVHCPFCGKELDL